MNIQVPMWLIWAVVVAVGAPMAIWLVFWLDQNVLGYFRSRDIAARRRRERAEFVDSMTKGMSQEQREQWLRDSDERARTLGPA